MQLTGKCQIEFDKWFLNTYWAFIDVSKFALIPNAMKFGIYQEFFDTLNLDVFVLVWHGKYSENVYVLKNGDAITDGIHEGKKYCSTRMQAQIKAINKANSIYNESKN